MSGCYYAGYAMESRCHAGKVSYLPLKIQSSKNKPHTQVCIWDTVKDHGWRVNLATHRIADVIENIIKRPDEFPLPTCQVQEDCDDCGLWMYKDPRDELQHLLAYWLCLFLLNIKNYVNIVKVLRLLQYIHDYDHHQLPDDWQEAPPLPNSKTFLV